MILKFIVSTRVQLTNEFLYRGIGRMTNKIRRNSSPKKSKSMKDAQHVSTYVRQQDGK